MNYIKKTENVNAIQFKMDNIEEIKQFLKPYKCRGLEYNFSNEYGKLYVFQGHNFFTLTENMWLVINSNGTIAVYTDKMFNDLFIKEDLDSVAFLNWKNPSEHLPTEKDVYLVRFKSGEIDTMIFYPNENKFGYRWEKEQVFYDNDQIKEWCYLPM